MDFLFHEVAEVALFDQGGRGGNGDGGTLHRLAVTIEDEGAVMVDGDIVAFLEIAEAIGEGADGQGVRAEEHLAFPMADHEGAAVAGAQDEPVLALDEHAQGIGALDLVERRLEGRQRRVTGAQRVVDQVGDDLGVGVAFEDAALGLELRAKLGEILNDAVVNHGDAA
jgi:hypothetical protein